MKCLFVVLVLLDGCRSATPQTAPRTPLRPPQPRSDSTEEATQLLLETLGEAPLPTSEARQRLTSQKAAGADLSTESVLSELEGRALLARLFRQAGFRILYDVATPGASNSLRLDGFDPVRQVGYEYVAVDERERVMNKVRVTENILLIGPTSDEELLRKARIFLDRQKWPESR